MTERADILEVARFSTIPEGELAVSLLQRHGVDARLPDRDMATMNPDLLIAIGGVRVVAPADQIARARAIVEQVRAGEFLGDDDAEEADWREDAVPGRVGELEEHQVTGLLGPAKKAGAVVVLLAVVVFPVAGCLLTAVGA